MKSTNYKNIKQLNEKVNNMSVKELRDELRLLDNRMSLNEVLNKDEEEYKYLRRAYNLINMKINESLCGDKEREWD